MFDKKFDETNEELFAVLYYFQFSARNLDHLQSELWRRGLTTEDYKNWVKSVNDKDKLHS